VGTGNRQPGTEDPTLAPNVRSVRANVRPDGVRAVYGGSGRPVQTPNGATELVIGYWSWLLVI